MWASKIFRIIDSGEGQSVCGSSVFSLTITVLKLVHNKIEVMSARIREIEEVLRQIHSETSDLLHPLLADSITVISHGSPESSSSINSPEQRLPPSNKVDPDSVIDAFGDALQSSRLSFLAKFFYRHPHHWHSWGNHLHEWNCPLRSKS